MKFEFKSNARTPRTKIRDMILHVSNILNQYPDWNFLIDLESETLHIEGNFNNDNKLIGFEVGILDQYNIPSKLFKVEYTYYEKANRMKYTVYDWSSSIVPDSGIIIFLQPLCNNEYEWDRVELNI